VDFLDLVTEVIDLRSFSNLWYWIVLAILWSSLSHWTLGVPYHIVTRARRGDDRAVSDMRALAEINGARILAVTDQSAPACWDSPCSSRRALRSRAGSTGWSSCRRCFCWSFRRCWSGA
jgi:hypothetical protein